MTMSTIRRPGLVAVFVGAILAPLLATAPAAEGAQEGPPPGNQLDVSYELLGPGKPTSGNLTFSGSDIPSFSYNVANPPIFGVFINRPLDSTFFVAEDLGADLVTYQCEAVNDSSICSAGSNALNIDFFASEGGAAAAFITLRYGRCDGRPATVFLSEGESPTAGNDVILGTAGADTINGLSGNDRICGVGGNDTLRGDNGLDRLLGGTGGDRLEGGNSADRLFGAVGADRLFGQAGNDGLNGGTQSDTCNGGTGNDTAAACEQRSGLP